MAVSGGTSAPGVGSAGIAGDGSGGGGAGVSGGGGGSGATRLPHWLLFPAADEFVEAHAVDLDHLVPHAGDVPVRPTHTAPDPFDEDLVVLVDEVDRSVADGKGGHLSTVLDQLDLHALPERGVRLLRFDGDLFEDDAFRLRRSLERIRFLLEMEHASLVISIRPSSALSLAFQLPRREQTPCHKGTSRELRPNFHVLFNGGAAAASTFSRSPLHSMEWIAGCDRRQKRLTPRGPQPPVRNTGTSPVPPERTKCPRCRRSSDRPPRNAPGRRLALGQRIRPPNDRSRLSRVRHREPLRGASPSRTASSRSAGPSRPS